MLYLAASVCQYVNLVINLSVIIIIVIIIRIIRTLVTLSLQVGWSIMAWTLSRKSGIDAAIGRWITSHYSASVMQGSDEQIDLGVTQQLYTWTEPEVCGQLNDLIADSQTLIHSSLTECGWERELRMSTMNADSKHPVFSIHGNFVCRLNIFLR